MVSRVLAPELLDSLEQMPAVAILGPRQVGKTTLALDIAERKLKKPTAYLDLELDSDLTKLEEAEAYLQGYEGKLLIIDEVQRRPELFRILRGLIDQRRRKGEPSAHFLLLGSASKELLQQSSESLAGRIRYHELRPFSILELEAEDPLNFSPEKLWLRGGFPLSYLASKDLASWKWREDFIGTYLERDIPQLGINTSSTRMRRFWTMLAHLQGQQVNLSALGKSLEVSHPTIRSYLDILTDLYMVRQIQPWSGNTKKRIVKSPKVFIRDTGLLHSLLGLPEFEDLLGHPVLGYSWEGFVIENILAVLPSHWHASYYRSAAQTEIDLVIEKGRSEIWAIEIKRGLSPKTTPGFHRACDDIKATKKLVVYSGRERFPLSGGAEAIGLIELLKSLK